MKHREKERKTGTTPERKTERKT